MQAVHVIWAATLLLVVIVIVPLAVLLLHRTLVAAMSIRRYLDEMLAAGVGIAGHTASIKALDDTIGVAGSMVEVAGRIKSYEKAENIRRIEKADDEGEHEACHTINQPGAELEQVIEQRGFRGVNIFLRHGLGASSEAPKYLSKSLFLPDRGAVISFLIWVMGLRFLRP